MDRAAILWRVFGRRKDPWLSHRREVNNEFHSFKDQGLFLSYLLCIFDVKLETKLSDKARGWTFSRPRKQRQQQQPMPLCRVCVP